MRRMFVLSIVLISACDSGDARTSGASNGATNGTGGNHDLGPGPLEVDDLSVNRDAFFEQDPPLMYCGLDGGAFVAPSPPGGTLNCPDDKNLEGCPCPQEGMMAACWPGKRVNRGLGVCMDGMTTCTKATEIATTWGPCMGAVLPTPGATDGAEACKCFSHGLWDVDNISPCGVGPSDTMVTSMYSSSAPPSPNPSPSAINCNNMTPTAANIWAHDTVTADCQGHFTLCYTLKAGDAMNKKTTDCVVQKICTTGDYTQVNMAQSWQPLPGWTSPASASACTTAFFNTGGYGEMSVSGETLTCDQLADHVFQTVTYCKTGDANCVSGGGGQF